MTTPAPSFTAGFLERLDARAKLVALIGVVVVTVATPATAHRPLMGLGLLVLGLAVAGRVQPVAILRRLLPLLPVLLVPATVPLVDPAKGWDAALGEMGKALIGCTALVLVAATTPDDRLLAGLRGLGCPRSLVLAVGMLLRYLHVLGDEARRLRRAAVARGWQARSLFHAATVGRWIGALFLRSHARAERVHGAMLARGYSGDVVLAEAPRLRFGDGLFTVTVLSVAVTLRWMLP